MGGAGKGRGVFGPAILADGADSPELESERICGGFGEDRAAGLTA